MKPNNSKSNKETKSQSLFSVRLPRLFTQCSLIACTATLVACVGNVEQNRDVDTDERLNAPLIESSDHKKNKSQSQSGLNDVVVIGERLRSAKERRETQALQGSSAQKSVPEKPTRQKTNLSDQTTIKSDVEEVNVSIAPVSQSGIMLGHTISQQRIDSNAIANAPPLNQVVNSNDPYLPVNNEKYASLEENSVKSVADDPVSTFSVDVDTGSYTNVRRMLQQGYLPQPDAVRVEEFINYFDYSYAAPKSTKDPFSVTTELAPTPWNANSSLLKIGLQAYEVDASERPSANLVFLMDVSGSMNSPDKLPLLKKSFRMLTKHLNEDDSVSIVVYAGASGVVLEPTNGDNKREILAAMSRLRAGGSTNGVAGIQLAYQMAEQAYIDGGINRIILATDGDFNVGTSNVEALKRLIEDKRKTGISLTTLGFGTGNYNDQLMEQIADVGNGNNAYIDSVQEAEKVLVTEMSSTLLTVAKDVKIQIEFNPMQVSEYRLIGYENRALKREDFNNDTVDAGEIGAGHNVTAIYEIFPSEQQSRAIDPLRYGKQQSNNHSSKIQAPMSYRNEIAYVKLRFKYPDADKSQLRKFVVKKSDERRLRSTSPEFRFAAAVSAFGQKLKRSQYIKDFGYEDIYELAQSGAQNDEHGYRHEFVGLVELAAELSGENGDHLLSETH